MRENRSLLLPVLLAALTAVPASLWAITIGCNEYRPATIEVRPVFQEVDYEFRQPMMRIRDIADADQAGAQPESWPVGLATGQLYMSITQDIYKSRAAYDPNTCGQIKAIRIELGFINNKIYVAREFPRRSCPYKVVLAHEEKHKTVDRVLLREYATKARSYFAEVAKGIGVLRHPSGAAIDTQIAAVVNEAMDGFSSEMESERRRRQKEVDSDEEYARITASCDGLLMQVVHDRLELLEETLPGFGKNLSHHKRLRGRATEGTQTPR